MFVDEVLINATAGIGGDGCMAFRREKFVPMGGPYGGSGGAGGNIVFIADEGLTTLIDLRYQKKVTGNNGNNGEGKGKDGKSAEDTIIKVPIGTTLTDFETGQIIADLTKHGEEVIVCYGGRGGKGNISLSSKTNPCPSYAERGEPGENRKIKVELRVLADIGLVGMPSVGKSTILSMISNANPKIASYHFTTLSPNLGVVTTKKNSFVVADLPGLIEGASDGLGLGHKFLKHIERTKIIAHVIDMSGSEERNPYEDYLVIRKELEDFSSKLLTKPEVIIANKMDISTAKDNLVDFKKKIGDNKVFEIEAINNKNLNELIDYLSDMVLNVKETELFDKDIQEKHILYKFKQEKPFTIVRENNVYIISGNDIEKAFKMTNFNTSEAITRFAKKLRSMGIDDELEKKGIKEGDIIRILDYEFEYTK